MSSVGYGTLEIIPSARGFEAALNQQTAAPIAKAGESSGRSFGGALLGGLKVVAGGMGAIGALVIGGIAKGGFSRALNIQDAQAKLIGLGNSAATVSMIMGNALSAVKGTAFGLDAAAGVAASAVAAGIKPGADLAKYLGTVADAATISGRSLDSMGAIFNKVTAAGKAYNGDLEQLSSSGLPIYQLLGKELGKTSDQVFDLASAGQISSAMFAKALADNIGGAALSSGATARGALANVGAALSRIGAGFANGFVTGAPGVFNSLSGAIDRAGAALKPYTDALTARLVPALASLAGYIDKVDFGKIITDLRAVYDLVVGGNFTANFRTAFHVEEDSKLVTFLFGIRTAIGDTFKAIQTGNFSGLGKSFGDVGAIISPIAPLFVQLAKGLGGIAGTVGEVIAAGFPLLVPILQGFADVLTFLGDHPALLAVAIGTIAAAFVVYRAAQAAANVAMLASLPLEATRTAAIIAQAFAQNKLADAMLLSIGAEKAGLIAKLPVVAATVAQTAANLTARVAMIGSAIATGAVAAATGVATAAQWLFNAALNANPIGLVVLGIAALVAGLVWFFTQTKLGQALWAGFMSFLHDAFVNMQVFVIEALVAVGTFFSLTWLNITNFVRSAVNTLVQIFLNFTPLGIVVKNFQPILGFFTGLWSAARGIFDSGVSGIVSFFSGLGPRIMGAVAGLGGLLVDVGRNIMNGLINGVQSVAGKIGDAVLGPIKSAVNGVKSFLGIKSPSRLFFGIGLNTTKGMANGLLSGGPLVDKASDALIPTTPTFKSPDIAPGGLNGVLATLAAGQSSAPSLTQNVYPTPGMSEETVAELSARKILRAGIGK